MWPLEMAGSSIIGMFWPPGRGTGGRLLAYPRDPPTCPVDPRWLDTCREYSFPSELVPRIGAREPTMFPIIGHGGLQQPLHVEAILRPVLPFLLYE
jgi:hypothetical protein